MRQLVGLACTRCNKTIPSIIDGQFCPDCGCPVHNRCAQPDGEHADGCSMCGSTVAAAQENQQEEKKEAVQVELDLRVNQGYRYIGIGAACLMGGVLSFLVCGFFGIGLAIVGFMLICFGLGVMTRKGPPEY